VFQSCRSCDHRPTASAFSFESDRGRSSRETLGGLPSTANNMRSQAGDDVDLVDRQIYPRLTRESVASSLKMSLLEISPTRHVKRDSWVFIAWLPLLLCILEVAIEVQAITSLARGHEDSVGELRSWLSASIRSYILFSSRLITNSFFSPV
jgi:hypothetical protein